MEPGACGEYGGAIVTWAEWVAFLASEEPAKIEVPKENLSEDDFIVWGEGGFERALQELEALEALEGAENTLSGSLTDAGFGSLGPI